MTFESCSSHEVASRDSPGDALGNRTKDQLMLKATTIVEAIPEDCLRQKAIW